MAEANRTITVHAPFAGRVIAEENLPDPVFAQKMMGEGIALEPRETAGAVLDVLATTDGSITSQWHHAMIVAPPDAPEGTGVLVHLGLNTVNLQGEGFTALRQKDDAVSVGEPLKQWDLGVARDRGLSVLTPIVLLASTDPYPELEKLVQPDDEVEAGDALFHVRLTPPRPTS